MLTYLIIAPVVIISVCVGYLCCTPPGVQEKSARLLNLDDEPYQRAHAILEV